MGSALMLVRAAATFGREVMISPSTSSFPSGPLRTAIFPPAPKRTLILRRSACTVTFADAASLNAFGTRSSSSANSSPGARQAAATARPLEARNRRRESSAAALLIIFRSLADRLPPILRGHSDWPIEIGIGKTSRARGRLIRDDLPDADRAATDTFGPLP